jgi:pimeloyl-ACP methyl ester carboxylesterase
MQQSRNKKVIILNGWTQGDISDIPEYLPDNPANWMGWLKIELEKLGYTVTNPFLKDGYKQEYEEWKEQLEPLDIDEETILIGWSAGGAFWVRWLGETKKRVDKLILVAPAKLYEKSGPESNFADLWTSRLIRRLESC